MTLFHGRFGNDDHADGDPGRYRRRSPNRRIGPRHGVFHEGERERPGRPRRPGRGPANPAAMTSSERWSAASPIPARTRNRALSRNSGVCWAAAISGCSAVLQDRDPHNGYRRDEWPECRCAAPPASRPHRQSGRCVCELLATERVPAAFQDACRPARRLARRAPDISLRGGLHGSSAVDPDHLRSGPRRAAGTPSTGSYPRLVCRKLDRCGQVLRITAEGRYLCCRWRPVAEWPGRCRPNSPSATKNSRPLPSPLRALRSSNASFPSTMRKRSSGRTSENQALAILSRRLIRHSVIHRPRADRCIHRSRPALVFPRR